MPEQSADPRLTALEAELAAALRTVEVLSSRLEALESGPPEEAGALAQALAGVQRELVQRTRTLEETEATWRALYESAPDPLLTVDPDGLVLAANRTAREVLDADGALVGSSLADRVDPSDAPAIERLAARGWRGADERRFTLRDGRRISLNARPIPGSRQGRHHVTVRDVTHREVLEVAEEERRRMELLASLASSLARDLNDPMSVVQGRLELLLELGGSSPEAVDRHLSVALTHARRVSAMLQNLRLVGRAPATLLERVFLLDAWEAAQEIVGPRLADLDLTVTFEPEDLAAGGTEALIARVLANLVERLADFCGRDARVAISARTRGEGVTVRLLGAPRTTSGELAPPPEADEAHLDDGGLGTSVARTLVRGVGGSLEIRSAGRRAMFDLSLPPAPAVRVRARPVEGSVLVVGDGALARGVGEALSREGFSVVAVPDAETALERLAEGTFEGVIASLLLPGASGLSLLEEVHRDQPELRGKLVLVADAPRVPLPASVRVVGAPFRPEELLGALGRRVRSRR